ncbi:MAG: hypothetical protein LBV02_07385 [Bacteroidales bacterium]|jgi:hypothetical protein|nr:hypothetical protein [Bacteroidales bacterium]
MTYSKLEKFLKLSSIALLLIPIFSKAQTTMGKADKQGFSKHEIGIFWGACPTSGVWNGIAFWMPGQEITGERNPSLSNIYPWFTHSDSKTWLNDEGEPEYYKMHCYGTLTMNYQYHFTQKHSIGVSTTWLGRHISNYTRRPHEDFTDEVIDAKGWEHMLSLCANYRFTYYRQNAISLYTAIHFGLALKLIERKLLFSMEQNVFSITALQVTGFGIEAGKIHAFITELGFGAQGLIKIGYRYKFNNKE